MVRLDGVVDEPQTEALTAAGECLSHDPERTAAAQVPDVRAHAQRDVNGLASGQGRPAKVHHAGSRSVGRSTGTASRAPVAGRKRKSRGGVQTGSDRSQARSRTGRHGGAVAASKGRGIAAFARAVTVSRSAFRHVLCAIAFELHS